MNRLTRSVALTALLQLYFVSLLFAHQYFMLDRWVFDWMETSWFPANVTEQPILYGVLISLTMSGFVATSRFQRVSDYLLLVLLMMPVLPMLAIYVDRGGPHYHMIAIALLYVMVVTLVRLPINIVRGAPVLDLNQLPLIAIYLSILFIMINIALGGLSHINFDFTKVYEYRRAASSSRGVFLPYLLTNLVGALLGLSTVIAFLTRRFQLIAILVILSVIIFGLTSFKTHFFVVFFSLAMVYLMSKENAAIWLVSSAALICFVTTLIYLVDDNLDVLATYSVRRIVFVPAYANLIYHDFFQNNPFMFWADSKVSLGTVSNFYQIPTPQLIANEYTGIDMRYRIDQFNNANTGFLGAGYAQAGYAGLILYSVIVAVILRTVDKLGDKLGFRYTVAGVGYCFLINLFLSSDLPTALLSHGVFLTMVIAVFAKPLVLEQHQPAAYYPVIGELDRA